MLEQHCYSTRTARIWVGMRNEIHNHADQAWEVLLHTMHDVMSMYIIHDCMRSTGYWYTVGQTVPVAVHSAPLRPVQ